MPHEWYVYHRGEQEGPYAWERLWELVRSGEVGPQDRVWTQGMDDWTSAERVPGLIGTPSSAVVPPPPPPVGAEAPAPPPLPQAAAPHRHAGSRGGPWLWVASIAGAIIILTGGCIGIYLLFLRDEGPPASPAPTAVPPAASTSTATPPDRSGEEETQQTDADIEGPTVGGPTVGEPTVGEPTVGGPTEPPDGDDGEEPTLEPTLPATVEPTLEPTPEPTLEAEETLPETPTAPPDASDEDPSGLPSPTDVVDEFIRVTLGTVPGAAVDDDRARVLMTVAYANEFASPEFVPITYGIQEGPTGYEIAAEEVSGSTASVTVLGYWGADPGRQWRFVLEEEAGLWRVADIEVLEAAESDDEGDTQSPFWQLNPVVEAFTVYPHGGWKLVVAFDPPAEDVGADFRIAYYREDDGSLAYDQESSGVIEAGRVRLTLDSDWSGYDLSQFGFRPGRHRVVAIIDGVAIASGDLVVE